MRDNKTKLIELLENKGPLTRDGMCEEFGFDCYLVESIQNYYYNSTWKARYYRSVEQYNQRTTVYDNLEKLESQGLVERFSEKIKGKTGRPPVFWRIAI